MSDENQLTLNDAGHPLLGFLWRCAQYAYGLVMMTAGILVLPALLVLLMVGIFG